MRRRNRLHEHGICAGRPYYSAVLKRQHCRSRMRWCNTVRIWDLENWRRVWFSDESRFILERGEGRVRFYRRRNKRFAPNCVVEIDNYVGGSVMVHTRKIQLVSIQSSLNVARYRDELLQTYPLLSMSGERFTSRTMSNHILHV